MKSGVKNYIVNGLKTLLWIWISQFDSFDSFDSMYSILDGTALTRKHKQFRLPYPSVSFSFLLLLNAHFVAWNREKLQKHTQSEIPTQHNTNLSPWTVTRATAFQFESRRTRLWLR